MDMRYLFFPLSFLFLLFSQPSEVEAQAIVNLETGAVFNGYNDVRIPGDNGTLFSLTDDLESQNGMFFRLKASYVLNKRHTFSILYAPLETKSKGTVPTDILYEGTTFSANTQLSAKYKFNSYRLTYRYDFIQTPKLEFGLGLTAKIRDARILISSAQTSSQKTNVGFVPIINFRLLWNIDDKLGLLFEGDALAAPQGRAEDVMLAATYKVSDRWNVQMGYRLLEGGADNDEVYNFSSFHYLSLGFSYVIWK
jgi:hypothetical protein